MPSGRKKKVDQAIYLQNSTPHICGPLGVLGFPFVVNKTIEEPKVVLMDAGSPYFEEMLLHSTWTGGHALGNCIRRETSQLN